MKNWKTLIIALSLFACKSAEVVTEKKVEEPKGYTIDKPIKATANQGNEWKIWFFTDNTATFVKNEDVIFENREVLTSRNKQGNEQIINIHDEERIKMVIRNEKCFDEETNKTLSQSITLNYESDEFTVCYKTNSDGFADSEKWDLTFITGLERQLIYDLPNRPFVQINSEKKSISGNNSCNNFNGTYKSKAGKIGFGPLVQTKMGCPDSNIDAEFMEALNRSNNFVREDYLLKFLEGEDVLLEFRLSE